MPSLRSVPIPGEHEEMCLLLPLLPLLLLLHTNEASWTAQATESEEICWPGGPPVLRCVAACSERRHLQDPRAVGKRCSSPPRVRSMAVYGATMAEERTSSERWRCKAGGGWCSRREARALAGPLLLSACPARPKRKACVREGVAAVVRLAVRACVRACVRVSGRPAGSLRCSSCIARSAAQCTRSGQP